MKPRQTRRGAADIIAFTRQHATIHANRSDAIYNAAVSHLDEGEAQALSLAHALGCGLLMDERRGRQEAHVEAFSRRALWVSVYRALLSATRSSRCGSCFTLSKQPPQFPGVIQVWLSRVDAAPESVVPR